LAKKKNLPISNQSARVICFSNYTGRTFYISEWCQEPKARKILKIKRREYKMLNRIECRLEFETK